MSVSRFNLSKSVSYPHIICTQKCKGIHGNPSKYKFEDCAAEIFVQQNVHNTTTKMTKTKKKLRNDHKTFPTCFNFNSKFPLFAEKVCFKFFKIN